MPDEPEKRENPFAHKQVSDAELAELSEVWRELLGGSQLPSSLPEQPAPIPALSDDPWSELSQARGVEQIDLQQIHLQMSDQEVEQVLQVMQEQPNPRPAPKSKGRQKGR